jgi:hypothetical protein
MPAQDFRYQGVDARGKPLKAIPDKPLDLGLPWQSFDIAHELTSKGIQKFVADYQSTLRRSAKRLQTGCRHCCRGAGTHLAWADTVCLIVSTILGG